MQKFKEGVGPWYDDDDDDDYLFRHAESATNRRAPK